MATAYQLIYIFKKQPQNYYK